MRMPGAAPARSEVSGKELTYINGWRGTDIRYRMDGERLKEDIVVRNRGVAQALPAQQGRVLVRFDLTLQGLTHEAHGQHGVRFKDSGGRIHFRIPRSFAIDSGSQGGARVDLDTVLKPFTGGVTLELSLDEGWLLAPDRVFPVIIDPSVVWQRFTQHDFFAKDSWINQEAPATTYELDTQLRSGRSGVNEQHILLQFPEFETLPQDAIISGAQLWLRHDASVTQTAIPLEVRRVTTPWLENVTWATRPDQAGLDPVVVASGLPNVTPPCPGNQNPCDVTAFDVTTLVRQWVSGELPNHGFRIIPASGVTTAFAFRSSNHSDLEKWPSLWVNYTIPTRYGADSHWTYGPVQSYGGGTTSQVNLTTGNLVLRHGVSSVPARGFDVNISLTYNSMDPFGSLDDRDVTGAPIVGQGRYFGAGWTMSQNLRLIELPDENGVHLKDGDGTWRTYLKEADSGGVRTYRRPLYYDYELTKDITYSNLNALFTLTQMAGGRKYVFDHYGRVLVVQDRNGNTLTYEYTGFNADQLTSITDAANRQTLLTYDPIHRQLTWVKDMANREVQFEYEPLLGSQYLKKIRHIGDTTTTDEPLITEFRYDSYGVLRQVMSPGFGQLPDGSYFGYGTIDPAWEATFDTSTEGWVGSPCQNGTVTTSYHQWDPGRPAGALKVTAAPNAAGGVTCGVAYKVLPTAAPLSPVRQDLTMWMLAPVGAPAMTGALFVYDKFGVLVASPEAAPLVPGVWTRLIWRDAPVDPATPVASYGVWFDVTGEGTFTGDLLIESLELRGRTGVQWDTRAMATPTAAPVAKFTYAPSASGGGMTTVSAPDSAAVLQNTLFTYNRLGRVTAITDPASATTTMDYYSDGRLKSTLPPPLVTPVPLSGLTTAAATMTYHDDPSGRPTNFVKDTVGPSDQQADQVRTYFGVNTANGDLLFRVDALHYGTFMNGSQQFTATVYRRDAAGNVVEEWVAQFANRAALEAPTPTPATMLRKTLTAYHPGAGGLVASVTRVSNFATGAGETTLWDYDCDSAGNACARNRGYLTKIIEPPLDGGLRTTRFEVAADGAVLKRTLPSGDASRVVRDRFGRPTQKIVGIAAASGLPAYTETTVYDKNSKVTSWTDGKGAQTFYDYDLQGQLWKVRDAEGGTTTYERNMAGLIKERIDGDGRKTGYWYDQRNLLSLKRMPGTEVHPSGSYDYHQSLAYWHDQRGNVGARWDSHGTPTLYTYTLRDQTREVLYPAGGTYPTSLVATEPMSFQYDWAGTPTKKRIGTRDTDYGYDTDLHLLADVTQKGVTTLPGINQSTLEYRYDTLGNLKQIIYPDGVHKAEYTYRPGGRMWEVRASWLDADGGDLIARYDYDDNGRVKKAWRPTNYNDGEGSVDYTYDAASRPAGVDIHLRPGSNDNVTQWYTAYDGAGNLLTRLQPAGWNIDNGHTTYQYDGLNRVKQVDLPLGQNDVEYEYDRAGNRKVGFNGDLSFQSQHVIPWYNGSLNVVQDWKEATQTGRRRERYYQYDGNGNEVRRYTAWVNGSGAPEPIYCKKWDAENRLIQAGQETNSTCSLDMVNQYNTDGLRTRVAYPNNTYTHYLYNMAQSIPQVLAERSETGSGVGATTYYLYGLGLLARRTNAGTNMESWTGALRGFYYFHDAQGNVRAVVYYKVGDSSCQADFKNCYDTYAYDAFGVVRGTNHGAGSAPVQNVLYAGEHVSADGTIYLRARHYEPGVGRFTSQDPLPGSLWDAQTQNPYAYAGNNPVTRSDPTGMCPMCLVGVPALVGGGSGGVSLGAIVSGGLAALAGIVSLANQWGRPGAPDHQEKIRERTEELTGQGYEHVGGGDLPEIGIPTPNGEKVRRFPDITMKTPGGDDYYENVFRPTPAGNVPKREQEAADDIEGATGTPVELTPIG